MIFDYVKAARRHNLDAVLLHENQRVCNADQLYGFAAECALVGIIRKLSGTGHLFSPDGEAVDRPKGADVRQHIDALWKNFWLLVDSHGGRTAMRGVDRRENPFNDWTIKHRYWADADCNPDEVVKKHRDATTQFLEALQNLLTKRTNTAPSGSTEALPEAEAPPEDALEGGGEPPGDEA